RPSRLRHEYTFIFLLIAQLPPKPTLFPYTTLFRSGAKGKYANHKVETFYANHIVIATGGCGQLYRYTSNAETVTGDGIALAYRAGAEIADMEFIQFHPTLLYTNGKTRGLISEAVRGEGARLITKYGKFIME